MRPQKTITEFATEMVVLEREIERHIEAGQIFKPDFDSLKYKVDRCVEGTSRQIAEKHIYGKGAGLYQISDDKHWTALVSSIPMHYAREITTLGKKLERVRNPELRTGSFATDCAAYFERYKGIATKIEALKALIISTKMRRDAKKEAAEKERVAKFCEYKTLVDVLQQHIDEYVRRAGEMASATFDGWMVCLEKNGWSLDKAAPQPHSKMTSHAYEAANEWRRLLQSQTDGQENYYSDIRKFSIEKKALYFGRAKDAAHGDYIAWIYKMIQKIGQPVTAATMSGNPWINSVIEVTTKDGGRQTWHTKMIVNFSKYGNPYNQFPSRRIEE